MVSFCISNDQTLFLRLLYCKFDSTRQNQRNVCVYVSLFPILTAPVTHLAVRGEGISLICSSDVTLFTYMLKSLSLSSYHWTGSRTVDVWASKAQIETCTKYQRWDQVVVSPESRQVLTTS